MVSSQGKSFFNFASFSYTWVIQKANISACRANRASKNVNPIVG